MSSSLVRGKQTLRFRRNRPTSANSVVFESLESRQFLSVAPNAFTVTNLVTDGKDSTITAVTTDPNLVNSWGIVINPSSGAIWVSDNGTGLSTAYTSAGAKTGPVVTIPPPTGSTPTATATPTGVVLNNTTGFVVSSGGKSGKAGYIFATEDGTIAGWSPAVDTTHAVLAVDNSTSGTVYKGLAMAKNGKTVDLYAADFHGGKIDVFDNQFHSVTLSSKAFTDGNIPTGFAPFNVQNIGGNLFVTYAMQDAAKHDDVKGLGNGFVDVFSPQGKLLRRFVQRGRLNSPWAVVQAPSGFGPFAGDILIGNFGDGRINVYNPVTGKFVSVLKDATTHTPITIDGLWGMQFGQRKANNENRTLFFASGPNSEANGLLGKITVG